MGHEHERLLVRPPPARRLRQQPREPRIGRDPSRPPAAAARSRRARAPPSAPRPRPAPAGCDRASRRRATGFGAAAIRLRRRRCAPARLRAGGRRKIDGHRHARRQPADVHAPRRAGARRQRHAGPEPRLDVHALGKLLRPQQLQQPEEPVRIVFERRRAEQQHVPPERGDRRDGAIAPARRDARADAAAAAPRRRRAGRCRPPPPAPVSSGRSTSVSSAITARRWTSNGLKPAPKSRATSARRGASSSVNTW